MCQKNLMLYRKKSKILMINKSLNYKYNTMSSYCLKCRQNTESKNPKVVKTKNGWIMLLPKCAVRNRKKLKFINEQKATGLLSNLTGIKVPILSDLPIINTLF